jgi:hypothetical protein
VGIVLVTAKAPNKKSDCKTREREKLDFMIAKSSARFYEESSRCRDRILGAAAKSL